LLSLALGGRGPPIKNTSMKPYRVLVCGTNYGRSYIQAVLLHPDLYQLVGIFSRGSKRSRKVAAQFRMPLYLNLEQLPRDIQIACVAVGSSAPEVMLGLLDRGVHVLAEHPQKTGPLKIAIEKAELRDLCFQVNPHFSDLNAPISFIRACHEKLEESKPRLIHVLSADRAVYGTLDILRRSFGPLDAMELDDTVNQDGFAIFSGRFGQARISMWLQSAWTGEQLLSDGNSKYFTDIQITAVFSTGSLSLLSVAGPVIWTANLSRAHPTRTFCEYLQDASLSPAAFSQERVDANLTALERLVRQMETGWASPHQSPEALLELNRIWEEISGRILSR